MFDLPSNLTRLIASGAWPSAAGPSPATQTVHPLIPAERVRRFAADESVICLLPPPFRTIEQERALGGAGDFWERFAALDQLDPARALIIGDFGCGSDSPVVLDFARCASNPPVLRLRLGPRAEGNAWVQGARDFDEFAAMLGFLEKVHVFISTGRFHSIEDVRKFIDQTYTEDGDGVPSTFMREVGLSEYEPGCIEAVHENEPLAITRLLAGVSYGDEWLLKLNGTRRADSAICVFAPNHLSHPERSSLEYLGAFDFVAD